MIERLFFLSLGVLLGLLLSAYFGRAERSQVANVVPLYVRRAKKMAAEHGRAVHEWPRFAPQAIAEIIYSIR